MLTLHRPANVDDPAMLGRLIGAIERLQREVPFVFPVHPRTCGRWRRTAKGAALPNLIFTEPLGYLDFMKLLSHARLVLTDSGGMQEETTFLGVPCLTMRENTERPDDRRPRHQSPGRPRPEAHRRRGPARAGVGRRRGRVPALWDGHAARTYPRRADRVGRERTERMTRNLLLLTYHFPPSSASGTFRMLGFARHLRRFGWRVQVIAPPEMPWDPVDPALSAQVPAETRVYRGALSENRRRACCVWRQARRSGCRSPGERRRDVLRSDRPDLVLTSGPPHIIHLLGLWLKKTQRLPWVADFRDPWISGAARVTTVDALAAVLGKTGIQARGSSGGQCPERPAVVLRHLPAQAAKVIMLTNGFDPPAQRAPPPPFTGTIRMLHAGEIYAGRDPLPLLDAIAELKDTPPSPGLAMRLEVMGAVHLAGTRDLATEAARRGLASVVQVRGQLPYQEALQEMAQSDLLVLLDGPGRKIGVPAKLYEYFGAGPADPRPRRAGRRYGQHPARKRHPAPDRSAAGRRSHSASARGAGARSRRLANDRPGPRALAVLHP